MKQTFFIPILILAFSFTVFAQTSENLHPKINIKSKIRASFEKELQLSKFDFKPDTPFIIDEYSELKWNDERARLDNVIATMHDIKDSELFAFISFNKRTSQSKRKTYLKKMLNHLTVTRSFEKNRLTFMISQSDEKRVYFQPVPKYVTSIYDSCEDCLVIKAEDFDKLTELFR